MKPMKSALLVFLACARHDFATADSAIYFPYPTQSRNLERDGALETKNVSLTNPNGDVRNQGAIGSCASHGWSGTSSTF